MPYILSNGYRWKSGSLFVSPSPPECYLQTETKREPDLRLVQRFNHVPFYSKTKTKQRFEKLYFTLLPLTEAGILSIKSWSSFGSASFSWKVSPAVKPSPLIVTVTLVTFIVVLVVIARWNSKELKLYNLSYTDIHYSGSFCKIATKHNYSQLISLRSHLLQDKKLCPQLQHNEFNMFCSKSFVKTAFIYIFVIFFFTLTYISCSTIGKFSVLNLMYGPKKKKRSLLSLLFCRFKCIFFDPWGTKMWFSCSLSVLKLPTILVLLLNLWAAVWNLFLGDISRLFTHFSLLFPALGPESHIFLPFWGLVSL